MITIKIIDYHIHSNHSFDSREKMVKICKRAVEMEIDEVCFTEHFSVNPLDSSYGYLDYEKYSREVQWCRRKFKNKIEIRQGLEIGEPHIREKLLAEYIKPKSLDFIIGSVHNIGDLKLREYMKLKSKDMFYRDYFEEVYKTAQHGDFDILGHLDLMKRYAFKGYGDYNFEDHKDLIRAILKKCIQRDIGIEVNTSGFRGAVNEMFPKEEIIRLYKDLGGEIITIGSDAHGSEYIGNNFNSTIKLLKKLEFKYIFKFESRRPIAVPIGL